MRRWSRPERRQGHGKVLKLLRLHVGLTQAQMAKKLLVSQPTIARFERGDPRPMGPEMVEDLGLFARMYGFPKLAAVFESVS